MGHFLSSFYRSVSGLAYYRVVTIIQFGLFCLLTMSKKVQKSLSLKQKHEILFEVDAGLKKKSEIAQSCGIPRSTLSTIIKNRDKIEAAYATNRFEPKRKRLRTAKNEDVETALMRWISDVQNWNMTLTGGILQAKAQFFAEALGVLNFNASDGWLHRFKERHGIICRKFLGEDASFSHDATNAFLKDKLTSILKEFKPSDIYNANETGLFWKALPDRTLHIRGQKCSGGKSSKERGTVMVACNMDGTDKLPLLLIGKTKNPICFTGVETLPVSYDSNEKALMTSGIFTEWLKQLDKTMHEKDRKICLIIDNCSAHCNVLGLKAIKILFLPPNATSKLQPCNQGIIRCLKAKYRKEMVQRVMNCFDNDIPFDINLLDALTILRSAWRAVSQTSIQSSFCHAGFIISEVEDERADAPLSDEMSQEMLEIARKRGVFPPNVEIEDYVTMDDNVFTSETLCDSAIISAASKDDHVEVLISEGSDQEEGGIIVPSLAEATAALEIVHRFLLDREETSAELNSIDHIQEYLIKCGKKTNINN